MLENPVLLAGLFGLISAATLPLGALLGVNWRVGDRVMAFFLAFGAGALLAALAVELVGKALADDQVLSMTIGAIVGGAAFKILNLVVNRGGGYLRKPSTAINYWKAKANAREREALKGLDQVSVLNRLETQHIERLLPHLLVRDVPKGESLYRAGDPAETLFVIERGEVELRDPEQGRRGLLRLGPGEPVGSLSFLLGCRRGTEAAVTADARVLVVPRRVFFELIEEHPELREVLVERLKEEDVGGYLRDRLGLSREQAERWLVAAQTELRTTGSWRPPSDPRRNAADLAEALEGAGRTDFFKRLSSFDRGLVAERLIYKSAPAGHTFFRIGELGRRLYILRRGTVALIDPDDPAREPIRVEPGMVFGRFSFFALGTHIETAVATSDCDYLVLRRQDFDELLGQSESLRKALATYLSEGQILEQQPRDDGLDSARTAEWLGRAVTGVQHSRLFPSLAEMKGDLNGQGSASTAILLGAFLDAVPESLVLGSSLVSGGKLSVALLGSILISNLPEAFSSAAGMRGQGVANGRILTIWSSMAIATGLVAAFGALTMEGAPQHVYALLEGFAAGAILTMVAETMLPEAFVKGGGVVGPSTLFGFLVAVLLAGG
jgi:CRP-like cAMP-binding protein/zinc transporter ZupT